MVSSTALVFEIFLNLYNVGQEVILSIGIDENRRDSILTLIICQISNHQIRKRER